jgi:hypothetical protein
MRSAPSCPAATIRRNAGPVLLPSGNASSAAISNVSGVVGVIASGGGVRRVAIIWIRRPELFVGGGSNRATNEVHNLVGRQIHLGSGERPSMSMDGRSMKLWARLRIPMISPGCTDLISPGIPR